jgi:hypothetical protein
VSLTKEAPLRYEIVEGNHLRGEIYQGTMTKLSTKRAEVRLEKEVPTLSDIKMQFVGTDGQNVPGVLYAKVVGTDPGNGGQSSVRFTSSSPETETFLRELLAGSLRPTI